MENTKERVLKTINILVYNGSFELEINIEELNEETLIADMGLNSITFIQLIVALENEFDIEFEDEMLDYKKISKIKHLCDYIDQIIVHAN